MSTKHLTLTNNQYEGVYSKYSRITPKYFADKNANSGRILDRETGDHFVGSLSDSYAEIRLLPISDKFSNNTNKYSLPSEQEGSSYINTYVGFFAVNVSEENTEKYEILPLVGDSFATFFYGSAPRQLDMAGIVFNTIEDNWRDAFDILYREYTRATAAARDNVIAQIKFGDRVVTGHIINMTQQLDAANPAVSSFTLKVIVRDVAYTSVANNEDLLRKYSAKIKLTDAIESSKFKTLDSNRLNTIRNFVRTSTLAPPPKMPVAKRASVNTFNKNCIITTNNDGTNSAVATGIQGDNACSAVDIVNSARAEYQNALAAQQKYLADNRSKGIDPNDPTLKELNQRVSVAGQNIADLKSSNETDEKGAALKNYLQAEADAIANKDTKGAQKISTGKTEIFELKVDSNKQVTINTPQAQIVDNILKSTDGNKSAKTIDELTKLQQENNKAQEAAQKTYSQRIAKEKQQRLNNQYKNSSKTNLNNTLTTDP
jgi:hypothetical protein